MQLLYAVIFVASILHGAAAYSCTQNSVNDTSHRPPFFLQVLSDNFYGLNPVFDGRVLQLIDDGTNTGTYLAAVTQDFSPSLSVALHNGTLYQVGASLLTSSSFKGPYAQLRKPHNLPRVEGTVYEVAFSNSTPPAGPLDSSWVLRDQSYYGFQLFTQSPRSPATFAVNWAMCKLSNQTDWILRAIAEDNSRPAGGTTTCRFVRLLANVSPKCDGEGYWP